METDFVNWLMVEIDNHGWTHAEFARRAGVSRANVSMVLSNQKGIGVDFCTGVARALGESPEAVLRRAGLLPALPPPVQDEEEVVGILRTLTSGQMRTLLVMLRGLAPREGFSLATDLRARAGVAEAGVAYESLSRNETRLLARFGRLPAGLQETVLALVDELGAVVDDA